VGELLCEAGRASRASWTAGPALRQARGRVVPSLTVQVSSSDGYIILTSLENRVINTSLNSSRLLYRKSFYVLKERHPKTYTQA
jgi:hypothetical protein